MHIGIRSILCSHVLASPFAIELSPTEEFVDGTEVTGARWTIDPGVKSWFTLPMSLELREMAFKSVESFRRESVSGSPSPSQRAKGYTVVQEKGVSKSCYSHLALWSVSLSPPSNKSSFSASVAQHKRWQAPYSEKT